MVNDNRYDFVSHITTRFDSNMYGQNPNVFYPNSKIPKDTRVSGE